MQSPAVREPLRALALASRVGPVLTGVAMTGVRIRGDRVLTVTTTAGDFHPGAVVMATGLVPSPWSTGVRQRWVKGHMVAVAPGPWSLTSVLAGPIGGGTPLPGGAVISGGTFDAGWISTGERPPLIRTFDLPGPTGAARSA